MITIQKADHANFRIDSLDDFSRRQIVTNVYRWQAGQLCLVQQPFTEDWSAQRKREKAAEVLGGAYISFCALEQGAGPWPHYAEAGAERGADDRPQLPRVCRSSSARPGAYAAQRCQG